MCKVQFHRRAVAYLHRMARARRDQMLDAIEEVAALDDITSHVNVRLLRGADRCYRLRVGAYRAVLQPREDGGVEVL